jgi:Tol biopolymer transport system component
VKSTTGAGPEKMLGYQRFVIYDWSHDGRWLIAGRSDTNARVAIWVIPQFGDRKPFVYLNGEYNEGDAKLSPNSHLLAYSSDESKRHEIFVQTFPEHQGKWQISTSGGDYPVWSRDGRELYYVDADRKMMAVEVRDDGKNLTPGIPKTLFELPALAQFDVSKDGRFLVQVPTKQSATKALLTVVTNWQASLRK